MDIILDILAIWGAFLSTILAIDHIRRERRLLSVECDLYHHGDYIPLLLAVTAVNKGHRPVTITGVGLGDVSPTFTDQIGTVVQLPRRLEDSDPVRFYFDLDTARQKSGGDLQAAFVSTSDGTRHRRKIPASVSNKPLPPDAPREWGVIG